MALSTDGIEHDQRNPILTIAATRTSHDPTYSIAARLCLLLHWCAGAAKEAILDREVEYSRCSVERSRSRGSVDPVPTTLYKGHKHLLSRFGGV